MCGDLGFHLADACERQVPACLQFRRHEPVRRIGGAVLPESPVSGITRRVQITQESFADLIALSGVCLFSRDRRCDGTRFDGLQKFDLDRVVNPQAAESDAARLAVIELPPMACVAWDVVLGSRVAHCKLAAAAPAPEETCKQCIPLLR